jgi:hypothetical protein
MNNNSQENDIISSLSTGKDESGSGGSAVAKSALIGGIDTAADATKQITENLQNALSQLTQPVAGITNALSQHPTSVVGGLKLLGKQAQLNMNATAQEVTGSAEGNNFGGDDGGGGQEQHSSNENSGEGYESSSSGEHHSSSQNYNPSEDPHLEDAGHKILGASSAEHSNDIDYHTATQKPISARSNDSEHSVGA